MHQPTAAISIPVFNHPMRSQHVPVVNARDLQAALGSKKDFSTWIKAQIERSGLVEGMEWAIAEVSPQKGEKSSAGDEFPPKKEGASVGRPAKEYILTLDAAKMVCMVSNTPRGKDVRLYFIECERLLREQQTGEAAANANARAKELADAEPPKPRRIAINPDTYHPGGHSLALKTEIRRHTELMDAHRNWRLISDLCMTGYTPAEIVEFTGLRLSSVTRAIELMQTQGLLCPQMVEIKREIRRRQEAGTSLESLRTDAEFDRYVHNLTKRNPLLAVLNYMTR